GRRGLHPKIAQRTVCQPRLAHSSLRDLGVEAPPPSLDTAPTPVPVLAATPDRVAPSGEREAITQSPEDPLQGPEPPVAEPKPAVAPEPLDLGAATYLPGLEAPPAEEPVVEQELPVAEPQPAVAPEPLDLGAATYLPGLEAPPAEEPVIEPELPVAEPEPGVAPEPLDLGAATYIPGLEAPPAEEPVVEPEPPVAEPQPAVAPEPLDLGAATYMPGLEAPPAEEPVVEQELPVAGPEPAVAPEPLDLVAATYMPGLEAPPADEPVLEPEPPVAGPELPGPEVMPGPPLAGLDEPVAPLLPAEDVSPDHPVAAPEAASECLAEAEPTPSGAEALERPETSESEALAPEAALPAALVLDEDLPAIGEFPLDNDVAGAAALPDVDLDPPVAPVSDEPAVITREAWTAPPAASVRPSLRDLGVEGPPPSLDTAPTPVPNLEPDDMFAALERGAGVRAPGEDVREADAAAEAEQPSEIGFEAFVGPPPPPARDYYALTMGPQVRDEPPGPPPPPLRDEFAMTMGPTPVAGPPPPVAPGDYALTMGPQVRDEPPGPTPAEDAGLAVGPPPPAPGTPLRRGSLQGMMGREQAPPSPQVRPTPAVAETPAPVPPRVQAPEPLSGPPSPVAPAAPAVPLPLRPDVRPPAAAPLPAASCPHCGARVVGTGVFCSRCGRPLAAPVAAPASVPATVFCAQCGYRSPAGVRFCMRCGAPMPGGGSVEPAAPVAGAGQRRSKRRRIPWWVWVLLVLLAAGWAAVLWPLDWPDVTGMLLAPMVEKLAGVVTAGSGC
ncbi:MAG: zinc ribbon domain-containing protein, partial [Anaerolineae bacterium]